LRPFKIDLIVAVGCCVGCLFGSDVEMKGILEMPFKAVQFVRKCKASWRCHPLADSRPGRYDGGIDRSLLKKMM